MVKIDLMEKLLKIDENLMQNFEKLLKINKNLSKIMKNVEKQVKFNQYMKVHRKIGQKLSK